MQLPGPEFFTLASRLPFYSGVMRVRAESEQQSRQHSERRNVRNPEARIVDLHDPSLAGLIQIG